MFADLGPPAVQQPSAWEHIGESNSGLHIFIDRASISTTGHVRRVTVRLGSPRTLVGKIVLVYQVEDVDCGSSRWRQVAFRALDEDGKVVASSAPGSPPTAFLDIQPGSISEAVLDAVCPVAPNGSAR
jgi:hypothetical protein